MPDSFFKRIRRRTNSLNILIFMSNPDYIVSRIVTMTDKPASEPITPTEAYFAVLDDVDGKSLIESAILCPQHALEIERVLLERDAVSSALLINIIRAASLIERTIHQIDDNVPHLRTIGYLQRRIRNFAMHLLPEGVRESIQEVIHIVAERTATEVAKPPVSHLNHHIRLLDGIITGSVKPPVIYQSDDEPIPIPSQTISVSTIERSPTPFVPTLELGTEDAPIVVQSDGETPHPPMIRTLRRKEKRKSKDRARSPSPESPSKRRATTPPASPPPSPPAHSLDYTKVDQFPSTSISPKTKSYDNFVCRNCKETGHRHKNCPTYWCRVCYKTKPGHLSIYCRQLKGLRIPSHVPKVGPIPQLKHADDAFYTDLKKWEMELDREEERTLFKDVVTYDPALRDLDRYDFDDDPIWDANRSS
jgi:hypothetical protein